MNILFLTPRFPYPLIGGDRIKSYNLLTHLAEKHNVTLVTFYQGKKDIAPYISHLESNGIETFVLPLNGIKSGLSCLFRSYQFKPLEILFYFHSNFQKQVDELIKNRKFDISFAFFMRTAEYLKNHNIKKVLIAEDCRILYQNRSFLESKNLLQKAVRIYDHLALKAYEPKMMEYFDANTFVTNEDITYLNSIKPLNTYYLLTNGTDVNHFVPQDFEKRNIILFTGKLDLWANKMMMERIIKNIYPEIKKKYPNLPLVIVGAKAPDYIKKLHKEKYLTLHENVPDIAPYLQQARLFLHPHLGASGIQNKLIEALSAGCPVVTTKSGNQGINGEHRKHLLIGDSDSDIVNHSLELLSDENLSKTISENGRNLILNKHSWERVFNDLDNLIIKLTQNGK